MDVEELLSRVELFSGFGEAAMAGLVEQAQRCTYRRNELLFAEGDEARELFIVVAGRVAIVNRSFDGRSSVVALMEAGDLFGEMGLFDGNGRSADARALEPSELVSLSYPAIRAVYEEHPQLLWQLVTLLARRLRATDLALADAVFLDVPGRTAKRLLEMAGSNDEFFVPVTQEELAGMVGASRERVNKAIATFIRLGWLEQSDRRYRILNRDQLSLRSR